MGRIENIHFWLFRYSGTGRPSRAMAIIGVITLLMVCMKLQAAIVLPQVLGNNMVLQCKKPVAIWGAGTAGETVKVRFRGQEKSTRIDGNGHWILYLDPMQPSNVPAEMEIKGQTDPMITLHNVLTGEVWLCSGQSNMEYTMRKNSKVKKVTGVPGFEHSPADELEYAHNPEIRIFLALRKPMAKPHPDHEGWSVAQDSALRSFSAAAYFFARKLYKELKVPIGMISNAIPGSAIEPWLGGQISHWNPWAPALTFNYSETGKFYPTLVKPLAPFTIKGFLWYQGETNCFMNDSLEYAYKMQALIHQWRTQWSDSSNTLPFYYVQIAPFEYSKNKGNYPLDGGTLPRFWEAQTLCLQIPHTGMVVTTDLPDGIGGIHPTGKWAVGERLAAIALSQDYGKKVTYSGPLYQHKEIHGDKLWLYFAHIGKGLESKNGQPLDYFELAGKDQVYYPANVAIKRDHLILSSSKVSSPVSARFAWKEVAQPNFFNKDGFPAVPFRTETPYGNIHLN